MSAPLRPPTVLVLGYFGSGNLGDEAILGVTLQQLRERVPCLQAIVPGDDPELLSHRYDVLSHSWQDPAAVIESVREADLVVVGGGGLLHDYWRPRPETMFTPAHFGLSYHCGMGWLAGEMGKPVYLHAVGVGPLLHRESRDLVRALAGVASRITVRDTESSRLLVELGMPPDRVEVTADPAWLVDPAGKEEVSAALRRAGHTGGRWIGVALRNWDIGVSQENWQDAVTEALTRLSRERGMGLVFLPFQHLGSRLQDDLGLAERVAEGIEGAPVAVVREPMPPSLAMGLIARASLLVGMRFHSVLFGIATGTPTVALAYDPKVSILVADHGAAAEVLRLPDLESSAVVQAAGAALASAESIGRDAGALRETQRARALRGMDLLAGLIEDPPLLHGSKRAEEIAAETVEAERLAAAAGTTTLFIMKTMSERAGEPAGRDGLSPTISPPEGTTVRLVTPSFYDPAGMAVYAGGGERYAMELVVLLADLGWDAEIVQPAEGEGWEREYRGVRVLGLGGLEDRFQVGAEAERRLPPVRLTIFHGFYLAAPAECRTPSIGISHGIYWDDPAWAADPAAGERERMRALEAIRRLDLVVSVDANTVNWVRAQAPELVERMVRFPNFVDLEAFRPSRRDTDGPRVVLFPRRLCAARGFWLLAPIVPGLLERWPDLEIHLVGDADPEEAHFARSLVERHPGRVKWYVLPPERMPEAFARAEIVLVPTISAEGTSLSLLEAQAFCKAVVTTSVGGLAELAIDGYNALVIEPVAAALEAAVERLLADPGLGRKLGARSRETAAAFGRDRWRARWERLLRGFLTPPGLATSPDRIGRSLRTVSTGGGEGE